jgi:hypothetical protein
MSLVIDYRSERRVLAKNEALWNQHEVLRHANDLATSTDSVRTCCSTNCILKGLFPLASHANAGTESQVELQVITHVMTQVD